MTPQDQLTGGEPSYDDVISAALPKPLSKPKPSSSLDDLIGFAKENNLQVGSTTGGRHNVGSRHYSGNAIDIAGSGGFDDNTVQDLSRKASERGLLLRDERKRPLGQKVWGGPHVHIERPKEIEQNPYDDVIKSALGKKIGAPTDGYDDVVSAALITEDEPSADTMETAPVAAHTRFGTTRAPVKPNRGAGHQQQVVNDAIKLAEYVNNLAKQNASSPYNTEQILRDAVGTRHDPTFDEDHTLRTRAQSKPNLRQIEDRSMSQLNRVRGEVAAHPARESARLFESKPTPEQDVLERISAENQQSNETAQQQADYQRDKPEVDRLTKQYRDMIRKAAPVVGTNWSTEAGAKGASQLTELLTSALRSGENSAVSQALNPLVTLLGKGVSGDTARLHAEAIRQAAEEEGMDRHEASKFAQDIVGGFIGTAPELLAMSAGVPAPIVFGAGSGARAYGMKRPVAPAVAHGALTGAAFEVPVAGRLAKAATVGGLTTGVDVASGQPLGEAAKSGLVNAAFAGIGGRKGEREAETQRQSEQPVQETPPIPANVRAGGRSGEPTAAETAIPSDRRAGQDAADQALIREQFDRLKAATEPEPIHHSTLQPRRARNTETGTRGQFKKGKPAESVTESPSGREVIPEPSKSPAEGEPANVAQEAVTKSNLVEPVGGARQQGAPERETVLAPSSGTVPEFVRAAQERKAAREAERAQGIKQMHMGADPYEMYDNVVVRGHELYTQKIKPRFEDWAATIKAEFGPESDSHLKGVWAQLTGKESPTTSIKNAAIEADREALGLPELTPAEHKTWQTSLDNAKAKGLHDADATDRIADRVLEGKKKGLDDEESAGMTLRIRELQNKHQELSEKIWNEKDPVKIFELRTDAKAIEDQFNKLSDATKQGGSDVARALAIRRSAVNENYDLVSLKRDFKTATGKEPTGKNLIKIEEQAKEIARLNAEIERITAEKETATSAEAIKKLVRDEQFTQRKQQRTRTRKALDNEAEVIKAQLAAVWKARPGSGSGIQPIGLAKLDPEGIATKLVLKLAKNRVQAGYTTAEGLVDAVHVMIADTVDLTKREVSEMISGYGKTIEMSKDEVDVKLRELKSIIASNLGRADVIEKGIRPLRRGLQRDKPTQEVRQAARELRDALREHGLELERTPQSPEEQQKSLLDAAKTSTRNRIEDLQQWIKDGKRTIANKTEIIPDAELQALRAERDQLTEVFKTIADPHADQQKIDNAMKAIEKSISDLETRIKLGDIVPKLRQVSTPWSPEIAAARKSQEALRGILSDLRAADRKANKPAEDPFEAEARQLLNAEKSFRKRAESQIADMEKRIQAGDYSDAPKRAQRKLSPEEQKLKDKLEAEKNRYQNLKRRNSPGAGWANASGMRKAWLLSWIKTHVRNIAGTGLYQPFDEAARLPAVIVDAALSPVTGQRGIQGPSPVAMLDSILHAARVGGREAKEILRHGATREDMERHQYQEINTGVKVIDVVHNAVFRIMSASDRVFYQGAMRRNLLDRAYIEAKNEARNDSKVNMKRRAKELSGNPTPELDAAAKHDALVNTFNNSNALSDAIKRGRSRFDPKTNFAIDMVMPFDRTPTNVIARILEASPVGLVKAATGGYKKSPFKLAKDIVTKAMTVEEQRQFSQTIGRATTGTALIGLGWVLAPKVLSTDDKGNVFLGIYGHKMNISTLSPIGNLIAIGARMRSEHDAGTLTPWSTAKIAGRTLTDQPMLRASSQVSEAIRDPERSAGKLAASEAYSFVPFSGLVRGVGETIDTADKRYPDLSFKEQLQRNFPVWRESLPMDAGRLFTKPNFIGTELERLGFKQGEVYKPTGIPEYDDRARTLLAKRLELIAGSRSHNLGYRNATDARKRWILREDLRQIRKDVIDQVEGEMPEAARKLKLMRQSKIDKGLGIPPDEGGSSNPLNRPSALERPSARP